MTELLEKAFAEAAKLSPDEQDLLARRLLGDLASEELWDRAFAQSQDGLAQLADNKQVFYMDIGDKFLVNGVVPTDIMADGLHPTAKGYQIWADAIAPTLAGMLKE